MAVTDEVFGTVFGDKLKVRNRMIKDAEWFQSARSGSWQGIL